ncbi:hypothetical protein U1Q18_013074 [Sarracenia purpurea var. burkii]
MKQDGGGGGKGGGGERKGPLLRDIRRYHCDYCGISRSKKSLLTTHLLAHHQDEMKDKNGDGDKEKDCVKLNKCEECGASFRKPAHLRQHMLSHSFEYQAGGPPEKLHQASLNHAHFHFERPFTCPVDDCHSSYRRNDHLTRHILQHQGKLFDCPVKNCSLTFSFQGNVNRHVKEFHDEVASSSNVDGQKNNVCTEIGCGKVFKNASRLRKHEASHVKLDTVEVFCSEPDCMKHFTNEQCLKAHILSCHQHIICERCGSKQLKKNIKRHLGTHDVGCVLERIKCSFKGCLRTFSTRSNLYQHVKAMHLAVRPFPCSSPGCNMRFTFMDDRDIHEKSGCHVVYTQGDFEESGELGGHKRKCPGAISSYNDCSVEAVSNSYLGVSKRPGPRKFFLINFSSLVLSTMGKLKILEENVTEKDY